MINREVIQNINKHTEDIKNLGSSLESMVNNLSTTLTIKSVGIQLENDTEMDYFINNFDLKLNKIKEIGCTDVILCPIANNSNTSISPSFTMSKFVQCCNMVKNKGLKLNIKIHIWGEKFGVSFNEVSWFNSYKTLLTQILNIGVARIGLMNEQEFLTSNDTYKTSWSNLCSYIKATYPNVELISSPTTSAEYNVLNHFCDYICFNCYPSNRVNKPVCNIGDTLQQVYQYTDYDIEGKHKNPNYKNKKIFITECGIQPYEYSHLYPWNWDTNPTKPYNEDVQVNFYEDMMSYAETTDWVTGLSWWISGSDDTTWTFLGRKAENVINKWWGDNNE